MTRKIGFYKKGRSWYADLPEFIALGGTEAECQMVSGADVWLDKLTAGIDDKKVNYIVLEISDKKNLGHHMTQIGCDDFGSTYIVKEYENRKQNHMLWLCPVTLSIFDDYPEKIYFKVIEKRKDFKVIIQKPSFFKRIWHIIKISPRFIKKLFNQ